MTGHDWFNVLFPVGMMLLIGIIVWPVFEDTYKKLKNPPVQDPFKPLAKWNPDKPNTEQGLYGKYHVCRVDKTDYPGGKHENCEYYVLDLTHDPAALEALHYYARAVEKTHPELSKDLKRKVKIMFDTMEDKELL